MARGRPGDVGDGPDCRHAVHLELPFSITTWDVHPDEPPADSTAPEMSWVRLAKEYTGEDLTGTAAGHALTTRGDRGASYVAQERIVGTLRGRSGSFVVEHGASMGDGQETVTRASVVAGSGTGELAGIAGFGLIEHGLLTLDIDLSGW